MLEIKFKRGAQIKCGDPRKVYNELERIRKERDHDGGLTADAVVAESKPKDALLHKEFEWDNKKAAHQYRLHHARRVIGSIEIVRTERPTLPTRAYEVVYESVEAEEEKPPRKMYRHIEDILSDPVARDELLANAIRDALAFRRRYHGLQELAKVFAALDAFVMDKKASGMK